MATACIVLAFVCFALVLLFLVRRRRRIRLVVARYKEDVGWIREVMRAYPSLHVVLCLKGPALTTEEESLLPPAVSVERLPNVGRCDHTFLDHIVRYYDALADVTVFASGAASDPRKGPKIRKVLRMAAEGGDTVLLGQKTDDARRAEEHFEIREWLSTSATNRAGPGADASMELAPLRPFHVWFDAQFPELRHVRIPVICWLSIFAVHRRHIRQHSVGRYTDLLRQLASHPNPEVGHWAGGNSDCVLRPRRTILGGHLLALSRRQRAQRLMLTMCWCLGAQLDAPHRHDIRRPPVCGKIADEVPTLQDLAERQLLPGGPAVAVVVLLDLAVEHFVLAADICVEGGGRVRGHDVHPRSAHAPVLLCIAQVVVVHHADLADHHRGTQVHVQALVHYSAPVPCVGGEPAVVPVVSDQRQARVEGIRRLLPGPRKGGGEGWRQVARSNPGHLGTGFVFVYQTVGTGVEHTTPLSTPRGMIVCMS